MATFLESGGTLIRDRAAHFRGIAVLVGVAGVPLIFLRFTNDPFNVPKLALLMAVVGVGAALLVIEMLQGYQPAGLRTIARPAIVFLTPLLLATVLSPYRGWALFGEYQRFQGLIPYALAVGLGVLIATTFAGRAGDVAYWFALAGAVAGAYATSQYFGIDIFDWANQFGGEASVTSTLGNTNFIGGFLAMTLPVAAALWMEDRTDYLAMLFSALILGGLILSFSQGGWAAALGAGAVYLGFELRDRIPGARWLGMAAAALIAVVAAGAVIWGIVSPGSAPIAETVQLRSGWWEGAWDAGLDHPVLGHGPNSFAVDWWSHRPPEDASVQGFDTTNDPHSVYLSLFVGA
ncbi:MAG: O-antigen ligase family protein, partial [Actinobacteria bacterium]|nr:O-antigen ligase family protein [Actinomycetota bacterium]